MTSPPWAVVAGWPPAPRDVGIGAVVLIVVVVVLGPAALVGSAIAAAGCLVWWWRRHRAAAAALRQAQLPDGLERLAGALRTGSSLHQALADTGRTMEPPLGPELSGLAAAAGRGRPIADVVDDWSAARADVGTRLVASAIVLATILGTAPARALDGVAATLRERLELAAERRALASQARTSALVLAVAPAAFGILLAGADPAIGHFLFGTAAGWLCFLTGLGLDALGAWWMSRLTQAAVL
jgi:tight adherence protein B